MVIWHLKSIGKVKKLDKWVPHELTENQTYHCFEVSSFLILCNKNKPFLAWILTCYKMWILYDNQPWPAQWMDQEKSPKHIPKPNLHQKKVIVTVGLTHYSFLKPNKAVTSEKYAQQIEEMPWKLQSLQLALVNRKGPILLHDSAQPHVAQPCFNSWTNWATNFCLIYHIHLTSCQRFITSSSISTTFCWENASTTNRRRKMLSKISSNPEAWIFMLSVQFSSVAQSCPTLWPHRLQHARPTCPSPTPRARSNSFPSRWWCGIYWALVYARFSVVLLNLPWSPLRSPFSVFSFHRWGSWGLMLGYLSSVMQLVNWDLRL